MKLLLVFLLSITSFAHQLVMTKIETLNPIEPYAPMVFHQGHLWMGRVDYSTRPNRYQIEVRSAEGEKILSQKPVPHSVERIYPFDETRILITGKKFTENGWFTFYSIARFTGKEIAIETHTLQERFQVEEFAGDPNNLFFNEVGDRSIVKVNSSGASLLPIDISGPGQMTQKGNDLWILERKSIKLGDENLVRLNLQTMKTERVFNRPQQGLMGILALQDGSAIATSEYFLEQIHLVSTKDPSQQVTIPLKGTHPRTFTQWGSCLIVGSEYPSRISVIQLKGQTPKILEEFNLDPYTNELPNLMRLTASPESASVFIRSAFVQEVGKPSQNSVYRYTSSTWIPDCEILPGKGIELDRRSSNR